MSASTQGVGELAERSLLGRIGQPEAQQKANRLGVDGSDLRET
jgi:hypothetical protein